MHVVVVHNDPLPALTAAGWPCPAYTAHPVTGEGLRAALHVAALEGAGHAVTCLRKRAKRGDDTPSTATTLTWNTPDALRRMAAAARPDWILCLGPYPAPTLAPIAPLVVDLYAPRMLEGAYEGLQRHEAGAALRAIDAADEVLFSNPRQRWFWMGLLGACGWDLTAPVGRLVPLAALPGPPRSRPDRPRFIAGGHAWPWQDLTPCLAEAAAILGDRAEIHTYGLPPVEGTVAHGLVSRAEWLDACSRAAASLDRYTPNPERALAWSFRQADALGCGLPLISDADTPLAPLLREHGAGWVDEPLKDALEAALAEDTEASEARHRRVQALAASFAPDRTEAPLLTWTPARRPRPWSLLANGARLARLEAETARWKAATEDATAEVAAKRAEVDALHGQVRALASSVEALSAAMLDVAAFRKETVAVLGTRLAGESATNEHLRRELEILRADLTKKEQELAALTAERDRLGRWLRGLRG